MRKMVCVCYTLKISCKLLAGMAKLADAPS